MAQSDASASWQNALREKILGLEPAKGITLEDKAELGKAAQLGFHYFCDCVRGAGCVLEVLLEGRLIRVLVELPSGHLCQFEMSCMDAADAMIREAGWTGDYEQDRHMSLPNANDIKLAAARVFGQALMAQVAMTP